ncbi:MAG TPA: glycoside hydrolase family 13 protein [Chitinophagaceae bacterium]|nr:glycoside hydrolase family 13 protein [Chitinophagaceae bacterium]
MKKSFFAFAFFLSVNAFAFDMNEVYPTHWWVGMKNQNLQLLIHRDRVANENISMLPYPGVKLIKQTKVESPNYLIIDIAISSSAKPGKIIFKIDNLQSPEAVSYKTFTYELKARNNQNGKSRVQGVTSEDLVYLIMPDRFSNGDPSNDRVPGMLDQTLRRDTVFNRHGGDLKGVQNHLDYLQDLGVSTIWLNPVIENDMPNRTEHGYAFTNHYKVDPRIGGDEAFKELVNAIHAKGMKIIQDAVYNHAGIEHFLVKDPPAKDWLHQWPVYTNTTYKEQTLFDPYAAPADKKKMSDGWFVPSMPDLNQNNPYMANFLIQHAIWTTEEYGIDGWRIDTYSYNDLAFMNRCNKALYDEFPKLTLFGETWVHGVPNQSYFCENNYNIPYKSNLQATTDFQLLFYGIQEALTKPFGWTEGVNKLYTTTAQDFVYKNPMRQVIFLDNHDLPRFYSVLNEDTAKYKMAFAWLMTFRGIPQMYYGNEILMTGTTSPNDGYVRQDFPGGWAGDSSNKFTAAGRTAKENSIFNYIKRFANFRKQSTAIKTGKLTQYVPEDGVYVYFRHDAGQTVMCVMNTNNTSSSIKMDRFAERAGGFTKAYDVATGVTFNLEQTLTVGGNYLLVMELRK